MEHSTVKIAGREDDLGDCVIILMSAVTLGLEDAIVHAVFEKFDALPGKSKPALQTNGIQTWVPLSGIVISHGSPCADVECISLG